MKINLKSNKGFTLIEMLTSIIVLIAIGLVISGIIASSLRGTNKTSNVEKLRQSGNYILGQMSRDIEYAMSFDGINTGLTTEPRGDDEQPYDTSCILSLNPTPTPVTQYQAIAVKSDENIVTKYRCTSSKLSIEKISPTVMETSLIDTSAISLKYCSLTCIQNEPTDVPIIKIKFELNPVSKGTVNFVENSGSIVFETSITMRNYRR